jgi:hypothetical protein
VLAAQLAEGQLDRQLLEPVLVVQGQRVVHVEADQLDLVHAQVAVAEDAATARDVDLGRCLAQHRAELSLEVGRRGHARERF